MPDSLRPAGFVHCNVTPRRRENEGYFDVRKRSMFRGKNVSSVVSDDCWDWLSLLRQLRER
jgi:hypothetical protein